MNINDLANIDGDKKWGERLKAEQEKTVDDIYLEEIREAHTGQHINNIITSVLSHHSHISDLNRVCQSMMKKYIMIYK